MKTMDKKSKWILYMLLAGAVLVCIKRIFTDFDIDCEYAIAVSYRLVRGDRMISQMWEPHQTSAFLNAFFIAGYRFLTGTNTGLALYLNVVGTLVKMSVAWLFYRTFRNCFEKMVLCLMCIFFLFVSAKNSVILDYSNMMVYFSVLLFCALFTHLQRQKGNGFLVLAAVFFCLEVLSYPSVILLFPLVLCFIYRYSRQRKRDLLLFAGVCFAAGGAFLAFLIWQAGPGNFRACITQIVAGDDSHGVGGISAKLGLLGLDLKNMALLFGSCAALSFLAGKVRFWTKGKAEKNWNVKVFFLLLFLQNLVFAVICPGNEKLQAEAGSLYLAAYLPFLLLAFLLRKYCDKDERMAFYLGAGISIGSCGAVLFLTNLSFLTALAYLIPGIMVSMVPVGKYLEEILSGALSWKRYGMICLFLAVMLFRNLYLIRPMTGTQTTVFSIGNVVRDGPMLGIFSDYMGPRIANSNWEDWKQFVRKGDKILIVGSPIASTIGYLYEDTEISVDSTICTPTYSKKLLHYWELNPWKEPNVVILDCWFGKSNVPEDEWIMKWIEENFTSYVDGTYIRVYRRE